MFFYSQVAPRRRRLVERRIELVRALRPYLNDLRLKSAERQILGDGIAAQLAWVLQHSDARPDADIVALYEEVHGLALGDVEQAQMDAAREDMADLCASFGLDVDVPELRADMSPEEIAASTASFAERMAQELGEAEAREQARAAGKRKTARQRREEEQQQRLENARRNSIGVVYKRLVKALHPDLEADPAAREAKTGVMQQVTAAYESGDLHTLLRLEAEWIHADAGGVHRLAAETLDAYTTMLKEQAAELEAQWFELAFDPRYAEIVVDSPFGPPSIIDGRAEAEALDAAARQVEEAVASLRAADALREVREMVRARRQARRRTASPRRRRGSSRR